MDGKLTSVLVVAAAVAAAGGLYLLSQQEQAEKYTAVESKVTETPSSLTPNSTTLSVSNSSNSEMNVKSPIPHETKVAKVPFSRSNPQEVATIADSLASSWIGEVVEESAPKPCRFFPKGTCKNGDSCQYAHVTKSDNDQVPIAKPCRFFTADGNCKKGDSCAFSHDVISSTENGKGQKRSRRRRGTNNRKPKTEISSQ